MQTDWTIYNAYTRRGVQPARLARVTEPSTEPITSAEAKLWLKIDSTDDDAIITSLIASARAVFESMTGRALIDTTYRAEWDQVPAVGSYVGAAVSRQLELPRAPFKSSSPVSWVKYLDTAGSLTTISASDYTVETGRSPDYFPRLRLKEAADWPDLGDYPAALSCQFIAGYGSSANAVPEEIKTCLKLLVAHFYQNRAPVNIGNIVNELPFGLRMLIEMHQVKSLA